MVEPEVVLERSAHDVLVRGYGLVKSGGRLTLPASKARQILVGTRHQWGVRQGSEHLEEFPAMFVEHRRVAKVAEPRPFRAIVPELWFEDIERRYGPGRAETQDKEQG